MKNNLSYLSGYIDGDGCFYIGKNIRPIKYRSGIIISSVNKDVLRFFKKTFGGNIRFGKKNPKFKTYNPINQWIIGGENSTKLAIQILPYLIEKRNDADLFIKFRNEKVKSIKDNLIQQTRDYRKFNNLVSLEELENTKNLTYLGTNKDEDFSYLAGFIDSECALGISCYKPKNRPNKTYKILLQCNNTKIICINWLIQRFGGCCYFVPRKAKNPLHKDQVAWRISSKTLAEILPKIRPFLKTKQIICDKLIEFYSTTQPKAGKRRGEEFKTSYNTILQKRDCLVDQIHTFNSKISISN